MICELSYMFPNLDPGSAGTYSSLDPQTPIHKTKFSSRPRHSPKSPSFYLYSFSNWGWNQPPKRYCSSSHTLQVTDFDLIVLCI
ncbi:hypothetical protein L1887_37843 [Cichorium endivia]|nr:hypothetical protein L1887_37843 [Cichorium endivia]